MVCQGSSGSVFWLVLAAVVPDSLAAGIQLWGCLALGGGEGLHPTMQDWPRPVAEGSTGTTLTLKHKERAGYNSWEWKRIQKWQGTCVAGREELLKQICSQAILFGGFPVRRGGSALSPPPRAPVQHLTLKWASLMIHNHIEVPGQGFWQGETHHSLQAKPRGLVSSFLGFMWLLCTWNIIIAVMS